jgi:hypothetical protein
MPLQLIPHIPEEVQESFLWMGCCLSFVQSAEHSLGKSLSIVFHQERIITIRSLEAEEEIARNKTIGYLLHEIRKRVDIDNKFDATLKSFLAHRNTFIHGLHPESGYDTGSAEGRAKIRELVDALISESWAVIRVLMVATVEVTDAIGETIGKPFAIAKTPEDEALIAEVRAMAPAYEGFFTRKN